MNINKDGLLELTNDEAREYFKNKNLSYEDIDKRSIFILRDLIKKELKTSISNNECDDKLIISDKIRFYIKDNLKIQECYLYLNSDYFENRECISFNKDGFIGFAGWACTNNVLPILRAFIKWCDLLSEIK